MSTPTARPTRGPTSGLLAVIGVYLAGLGVWWLMHPTESRSAGVQWINDSPLIPVTGLTSAHVAWWWVIGGAIALTGAVASRWSWAERAGVAAAIFCPSVVAAIFVGAWIDGDAPTGGTAAWSYCLPAALTIWHVSAERRRVERGDLATGTLPTIREGR